MGRESTTYRCLPVFSEDKTPAGQVNDLSCSKIYEIERCFLEKSELHAIADENSRPALSQMMN